MICDLPEILVIHLAFGLAARLTADYMPRIHRLKVASECRQLIRGVPLSDRRFAVGYLRQGVMQARKERIERHKFPLPSAM